MKIKPLMLPWLLASALALVILSSAGAMARVDGSGAGAPGEEEETDWALPPGGRVTDARMAFVNLPLNVLEILPKNTRLYMLDYFAADSIWEAPNAMESTSKLVAAGKDYLKVMVSPVSTLQIRMLPKGKDNIVMTIYTVGAGGEAPDSDVRFFDSGMQELPRNSIFRYPSLSDFVDIPKGSITSFKELRQMVAFPTYEFTASAQSPDISGVLTVGEYMTADDYNILKLFLRPKVTFRWTGKNYKLDKEGTLPSPSATKQ